MIYEIRHPMARGTVIPLYGSDVFIFLDSTTRLMDFRLDRFMCKRDKISWNFTLLLSDPHSFSSNLDKRVNYYMQKKKIDRNFN